ncbi:hypothetical protein D9M69_631790 [compost metagenome]
MFGGQLAGFIPETVITSIQGDLFKVKVGNIRTNVIQEVPVMGNHDHRILKVHQEVFQPEDRLDVKVVRRLIQEQHIGVAEQRLGQQYFHFLRRVHLGHHGIVIIFGDSQAGKQCRRI